MRKNESLTGGKWAKEPSNFLYLSKYNMRKTHVIVL